MSALLKRRHVAALQKSPRITDAPEQRSIRRRRLADTRRCMFCASRSRLHRPCIRSAARRKRSGRFPGSQVDLRWSKEPVPLRFDSSYRIAPDSMLFELPFPAGPGPSAPVSGILLWKGRRPVPAMCTSLELMFSLGFYIFSRLITIWPIVAELPIGL